MFIDAQDIPKNSNSTTDICIIGAGAAGIAMALSLKKSGLKVCVLESGGLKKESDTQALYDLTCEDLPLSEPSRARVFGGSTVEWAGRWKPHDAIDFTERSWIPYSGWPITYTDVAPYYAQSTDILGTPHPDLFTTDSIDTLVAESTHPILEDDAMETSVFRWLKEPDWNWGKKFKEHLEHDNTVEVILHANVTQINLEPQGKCVESVTAQTLQGNIFTVSARHTVVASGGIENARLLLLSRNVHAQGIGNTYDQVGRYYMDHPKGVVGEITPYKKNTYLPAYWGIAADGLFTRAGLKLTAKKQEQERVLNSYVLLEPVFPWSYNPGLSALVKLAQGIKRRNIPVDIVTQYVTAVAKNQKAIIQWGMNKVLKSMFNKQARIRAINVWNFMEQVPDPHNRVILNTKKDALGCEQVTLHWSVNELDRHTMEVFHQTLHNSCQQWRIGEFSSPILKKDYDTWPISNDASHHMGTTRMGTDPKTSVVNSDCKVHGVENLFVAGSSVFPTGGYANPTATIVALALRLSDHLQNICKKNNTSL